MAGIFGFKTKEQSSGFNPSDDFSDNTGLEEISGLSQLYSPEQDTAVHVRDIADVLHEMEKINSDQLSEIRRLQEQTNHDVSEII